jgi:C-terminal processing protease CtpA/Prc
VANDLLRLEMQLKMVGSGAGVTEGSNSVQGGNRSVTSSSRLSSSRSATGGRRTSAARRSRITVTAPPGKLGIILANKADSKGTVVSGVRTSSALADQIHPGDRIVAIDGEDVSLMTVSEITTIMARKSDFERKLTVLTTPRQTSTTADITAASSPRSTDNSSLQNNMNNSSSSHRYYRN